MLTADATDETRRRALSAGARDFLTKPLDRIELQLRVRNLLEVQLPQDRLREQNGRLEATVTERTRDLDQSRLEVLERLALALGLPDWEVTLIGRAAPLHDVGKIGIPDAILLKPGRLTDAEFEVIKTHARIGAEILAGSHSPLLRLAERIALTHHERWDGSGYPMGPSGEEIPIAARIVAVADVFDALTHERPYKQAWPIEKAMTEILGQAGRQFDPGVVDAFSTLDHPTLLRRVRDSKRPRNAQGPHPEARRTVNA